MVRVMKEITSGRMHYGRAGRRPYFQPASGVPLTGIRARVNKIVADMPLAARTGKGSANRIVTALREAGFEARASVGGIDIRERGAPRYTFFNWSRRKF